MNCLLLYELSPTLLKLSHTLLALSATPPINCLHTLQELSATLYELSATLCNCLLHPLSLLPDVDCFLPDVDCLVPAMNCFLPSMNCLLFSVNCLLFSMNCLPCTPTFSAAFQPSIGHIEVTVKSEPEAKQLFGRKVEEQCQNPLIGRERNICQAPRKVKRYSYRYHRIIICAQFPWSIL